jgi:hypothetical protein
LLQPLQRGGSPRQAGAIILPIAMERFLTSQEYRNAILEIQRDIWECGCVVCSLFLEDENRQLLNLCRRWGLGRISIIIWALPVTGDRNTILRLQDIGVRITCIPEAHHPKGTKPTANQQRKHSRNTYTVCRVASLILECSRLSASRMQLICCKSAVAIRKSKSFRGLSSVGRAPQWH